MAERLALRFSTASQADAERFLEEYVLRALDRVAEMDACDGVSFVPDQPVSGDRTAGLQVPPPDHLIYLSITGQTDEVVGAERARWEALVEEDVVSPVPEHRVLVHEPSGEAFDSITQLAVFHRGGDVRAAVGRRACDGGQPPVALPGLRIPCGSRARLSSAITDQPSPCSARM